MAAIKNDLNNTDIEKQKQSEQKNKILALEQELNEKKNIYARYEVEYMKVEEDLQAQEKEFRSY